MNNEFETRPAAIVVKKLNEAGVDFQECYPDLHDLQKWYLETSESVRDTTHKMQDVGLKIIDTRRENDTSFIQFRVPEIESRTEKIARLEAQLASMTEERNQWERIAHGSLEAIERIAATLDIPTRLPDSALGVDYLTLEKAIIEALEDMAE